MGEEWKSLADRIRKLVLAARSIAAHGVNTLQVATNFEVGRLIVEQEQKGKKRAEYGKRLLIELSRELTAELGRGYSLTNLKLMRQFYLEYSLGIGQTAPDRFPLPSKGQTASDRLPSRHEVNPSESGFIALSWSHYVFLLSIRCADERSFYEIESLEGGWSLRELKRQFDSGLYERLALSRDKKRIRDLSRRGQVVERPQDILKEPYVLEFLGLGERDDYSERDLETAIIGKLEHFLLELGKGFLFEGRQRRFTFGADHFFVDLVFYNRVLRCYVLVDLKLGRLAHQDLGHPRPGVVVRRHRKAVGPGAHHRQQIA